MNRTETLHIRIPQGVKSEAEQTFKSMGMTTADAVNIFLHQVINTQSIPFSIKAKVPNAETLAAMKEAEEIADKLESGELKSFTSVDEMFKHMGINVND